MDRDDLIDVLLAVLVLISFAVVMTLIAVGCVPASLVWVAWVPVYMCVLALCVRREFTPREGAPSSSSSSSSSLIRSFV